MASRISRRFSRMEHHCHHVPFDDKDDDDDDDDASFTSSGGVGCGRPCAASAASATVGKPQRLAVSTT